MSKITLFHIDDHPLFSQGVSSLLKGDPQFQWLGEAIDAEYGKRQVAYLQPDIVLLDYFLPDTNGIALGKEISKFSPRSKLVLFTMENSPTVVKQALESRFFGFISKSVEREILIKTLTSVGNGEKIFPQLKDKEIEKNLDLSLFNQLSKREKEIALMVKKGFTSSEIAEKLFISLLTVNTHRRNLIQKLGFKNVAQLSAFLSNVKNH
ncbi:response regulator transcription factor [Algoriphagus boritolerans]|uniref:Two component transcriptional regulator, LuxR family n=1 Tax=Algoriphagus boritolerans DSM 17298 = JCM 18970 TaxID=1120964 RepID=A0A1H5ZE07_9BACT|nr:response regulator transcription factor [Algoriphagus boritolerans]SEG34300.1 two component transcriptional regulator, LuxR family [Algoriphagus boritolerans DSM 17298 = JCM 18970]